MKLLGRDQVSQGISLTEYLVVLALVAIASIGVAGLFGQQVKSGIQRATAALSGESAGDDKAGEIASAAVAEAASVSTMADFASATDSGPGEQTIPSVAPGVSGSGASTESKFLPADETKRASAAAYVANKGDVISDKSGRPLWKVAEAGGDSVSGFRYIVLEPVQAGERPVLAFAGTGGHSFSSFNEAYDWVADIGTDALQLLAVPTQYEEAKRIAAAMHRRYSDLVVAGHSLAGGMAVYAGMINGLDVATINPAQLGAESQWRLWLNAPEGAAKNVRNYLNNEFVGSDILPVLTRRYGEDCYFDSKSGIFGRYTRHSLDNTDASLPIVCQ